MEGKKSFMLYCDMGSTFDALPNEIAGQLIKLIFDYVRDKNPVPEDLLLNVAFEPIKNQLKRDLQKWNKFIEKQRVNGEKGGRPKKPKETQETQAFISKPKKAVNVTVTDTVINNNPPNPPEGELSSRYGKFISTFNSITGKKFRGDKKSKGMLNGRLSEGYTPNQIVDAIKNCFADQFHRENPHYLTPEFILRPDKLQKYYQANSKSVTETETRVVTANDMR